MEGALRVITLAAFLPFVMPTQITDNACSCAVFAVPWTEPILKQTLPHNVSCDQEGANKCQQLCLSLAEEFRDRVPTLICRELNIRVKNLKVAVYMKSCSVAFWTFTGLESTEPICCDEGKATVCDEACR